MTVQILDRKQGTMIDASTAQTLAEEIVKGYVSDTAPYLVAEFVLANAPGPTIRERIEALPVGTVWSMRAQQKDSRLFLKDSAEQVTELWEGGVYTTHSLSYPHNFKSWGPDTEFTIHFKPEKEPF